ncbi:MAG: hypothetical protein WA103_04065, partial [Minisyncoccales bacterium]
RTRLRFKCSGILPSQNGIYKFNNQKRGARINSAGAEKKDGRRSGAGVVCKTKTAKNIRGFCFDY